MINNGLLTTPTLAIKTGTSPTVAHAAFRYNVNGVLKAKGAGDAPALAGTVADDFKLVCALYITAAGTLVWEYSDPIALADDVDVRKAAQSKRSLLGTEGILVGYVVVINETGSVFTLATTALDVANSTVYYINAFGVLEQGAVYA